MNKQEETLTKQDILSQLEPLVNGDDVLKVKHDVSLLISNYSALTRQEKAEQEKDFYKKEDKEEDDVFEFVPNPLDIKFIELRNTFNDKLKAAKEQKKKEEKENLAIKKELIEELKALVENGMENPGEAFKTFYEIRDKWDNTGDVNKANFKDIQSDYSLYRDKFYYNVDIFNELKSYDLKINAELKEGVIKELETLKEKESIKEIEQGIKDLQSKWDKIGPTSNEQWEELKTAYWDNVNAIYDKIRTHYATMREKQQEAFDGKTSLVGELEALKDELLTYTNPKQWTEVNKIVNVLHQKWKDLGFAGKDKEDDLWNNFSQLTDDVRTKVNEFFSSLKDENSKVEAIKEKIIAKAESLKDSKEWRETTQAFKRLQTEWQKAGKTLYKKDQELWNKFRAAADTFFNAKKEFFDTLDDRQAENLTKKEAIVKQIQESTDIDAFEEFIKEWQLVGYVPKKDIKNAEKSFEEAVKSAAKRLGIEESKLDDLLFKTKVAAIKEDDNAEIKLKSEKNYIQSKIDTIKEEMNQYQNNMAFFGNSKGAQKLKEVVEKKVSNTEKELEMWYNKLKQLK